ncbi:MAG: hypothetical protein ACRDHD_00055 [Candidatus Limnocylindria bacterium]
MIRRTITALTVAGILGGLVVATAVAKAGSLPSELQAVRSAVASYHSYDQALADGYSAAGEPCVAEPGLGTMGIHAVNYDLLASGANDPLRPPILLYVPRDDGSLRLVGVEYFMVALANPETGPAPWFASDPPPLGFFNPAPSIFGQTFDGPMPGHNPAMPWHYDLHAWVVEENPSGIFAPFNPALSCS